MQISVELMAIIRRPNDVSREFNKILDKALLVKEFLIDLGFTPNEIRIMQFFISKSDKKKDAKRVSKTYELEDGDHLFITIPIGGG